MARVKRGFKRRQRTNKIFAFAKGYRDRRRTTWRRTVEQVHRSWAYAYVHRRLNKRNFRGLWIIRINAACRINGTRYSDFIHALALKNITVDRKVLAEIAVHDPEGFARIVRQTAAA